MQVYIKRAYQGRLRQTADGLGEQYAPKYTTGRFTFNYTSDTTTTVKFRSETELGIDLDGDGRLESDVFGTETIAKLNLGETTKTGSENVGGF